MKGKKLVQQFQKLVLQGSIPVNPHLKQLLHLGQKGVGLLRPQIILVQTGDHIPHNPAQSVAEILFLRVRGQVIQNKDIHPGRIRKSVIRIQIILVHIDNMVAVADPGNEILVIGRDTQGQVLRRQLLPGRCTEADVIIPQHADIQVIIPGNETAVADSPKKASAVCIPADLVSLTDFGNLFQNFQLCGPRTLHNRRHIEPVSYFIFKIGI